MSVCSAHALFFCTFSVCEQNTLTRHFLMFLCTHNSVARDIGSSGCPHRVIHVSCAVFVLTLSDSPFCTLHSLSHLLLHPPGLHLHLLCGSVRREFPCVLPRMRSLTLWSTALLSQVMSPSSSTTTTSQRPLKFSSTSLPATAGPRTCMTRRSATIPSAERSLHHCSFRSEKNQRAVDKLTTLEESKLSSQSLSVGHVRTGRPVDEFVSLISNVRENPCRDSENEQIRIHRERLKEQILAECQAEIQKHEFHETMSTRSTTSS